MKKLNQTMSTFNSERVFTRICVIGRLSRRGGIVRVTMTKLRHAVVTPTEFMANQVSFTAPTPIAICHTRPFFNHLRQSKNTDLTLAFQMHST